MSTVLADTSTPPTTFVVTLVHGTYATKAEWVRSDSLLCRQLACDVAPANVVVRPFGWSGRNSAFERRRASLRLREHLRECLSEYPGARHFIVAHSHGGNVAAMSLEEASLRSRMSGLACLSTPFLVARRRPFGAWLEGLLAAGLALLLLVGLAGNIALSILSGVVLGGLLVARLTSLPARLIQAVNVGDVAGLHLLIVRSAADETIPLFAIGQLVGWLSSRLYALPAHLASLATRGADVDRRTRSLSRVALVVGIPLVLIALFSVSEEGAQVIGSALAPAMILAAILGGDVPDPDSFLLVLTGGIMIGSVLLVSVFAGTAVMLTAAAVGWAGVICGLVVEVATEVAPPGQWLIRQLPFASGVPSSVLSLQHSTTYEDPRAIEAISAWAGTVVQAPE